MMTVIPAQVAGVATICVACPNPSVEILGIAHLLGVTHMFRMGGAQAIAAFAYGTETVPKVDRIVGPGNIYVAAAKKLLAGEVGIDFVAGPTEIVVIAADGNPRWIAADLLAQAEHDVDASAILLTTSRKLAEAVSAAVERQLTDLPTAHVARPSIDNNGAVVVVDSIDQAIEISNSLAPEHLSLHMGRTMARCWRRSSTQAPCSSVLRVRKPRATTAPARITSCRRRARRAFAADSPAPISSRSSRCRNFRTKASAA